MENVNLLENSLMSFQTDTSPSVKKERESEDKAFQLILEKQKHGKFIREDSEIDVPKEKIRDNEITEKTYKEILNEINLLLNLLGIIELNNIELNNIELNNIELSNEEINDSNFQSKHIELKDLLIQLEEMIKSNEEMSLSEEDIDLLTKTFEQIKRALNEENVENIPMLKEIETIISKLKENDIKNPSIIVDDGENLKEEEPLIFKENKIQGYEIVNEDNNVKNEELKLEVIDNMNTATSDVDIVIDDTNATEGEGLDFTLNLNSSHNELSNDPIIKEDLVNFDSIEKYDSENLLQQLVEEIKFIKNMDKQEIRLKLKPDYLGELLLKLEEKDGVIQAKIFVDNYRTKEIIESNLFQLKEQFEDNKLSIRTFEVYVGTNEDYEMGKRNRYSFNKRASKLKTKMRLEEELKIYDNNINTIETIKNYEGRLNLFV